MGPCLALHASASNTCSPLCVHATREGPDVPKWPGWVSAQLLPHICRPGPHELPVPQLHAPSGSRWATASEREMRVMRKPPAWRVLARKACASATPPASVPTARRPLFGGQASAVTPCKASTWPQVSSGHCKHTKLEPLPLQSSPSTHMALPTAWALPD